MRVALLLLCLPSLALAQAMPRLHALEREGVFGTRVRVMLWSADEALAQAALMAAFAELERLEAALSEWRPASDISRLNQSAGKGPVTLGPDALAVLARGRAIHALTGGAFALTWAALLPLWNFSAGAPAPITLPDPVKAQELASRVDDQKLVIDPAHGTATLPAGMTAGVGAIAEGYGLMRVLAVLKERGMNDALVFIGGDIGARGQKGDKPWLVGVQDPRGDGYFAVLPIPSEGEFVCTSGDYEKFFVIDGKRYTHVLDPRTGMPAQGLRSATVVGKDAMTADAVATALMVLGAEAGMKLIEEQPELEAVLVDAENNVLVSSGLKARLRIVRAPSEEAAR